MEFIARQVQVPASELGLYEWTGRTAEYHHAQIREHPDFRACGIPDAEKLTAYLAETVAYQERRPEQVRMELPARCRAESIEPPTPDRCDRIVATTPRAAEEALTTLVSAVAGGTDQDDAGSADGGAEGEDAATGAEENQVSAGPCELETMPTEIDKLLAVRAIGLPPDLFIDVTWKVLTG